MFRSFLIVPFLALGLSGCISLLPDNGGPSPRIGLDPGAPAASGPARHDVALMIGDPAAAAALNSFSVAVVTAPLEYQYLADAEWTDRVPVLVRRFTERRFSNSGRFQAVGDRTTILRPDYTLQTDIRAFYLDQKSGQNAAVVTLGARLVDGRGRVVATSLFTHEREASGTSRQARAAAFNEAARAVVDEMIDWVDQGIAATT